MAKPRKGTVLVIEDDEAIRDSIREFLELEGFRVVVASNGKEGLERLEEMTCPCLIVLDMFMPVMDGAAFLQALRARPIGYQDKVFSIPVALITAAPPASEKVATAKPLVREFIKKPIELDAFLQTVTQYCGGEMAA